MGKSKRRHRSSSEDSNNLEHDLMEYFRYYENRHRRKQKRRSHSSDSRYNNRSRSHSSVYSNSGRDDSRGSPYSSQLPLPEDQQYYRASISASAAAPSSTTPLVSGASETASTAPTPFLEQPLNAEILAKIGQRVVASPKWGAPIHQDFATIWKEVTRVGLSTEECAALVQKYPLPENCSFLVPPQLNLELSKAVAKNAQERDVRIVEKQDRTSACLSALGRVLTAMVAVKPPPITTFLEPLCDMARMLSKGWHDDVNLRRNLVLMHVNTSIKDALSTLAWDDLLFGDKFVDKLKMAKVADQSIADLKLAKSQPAPSPQQPAESQPYQAPKPSIQPPSGSHTQGHQKQYRPYKQYQSRPRYHSPRRRSPYGRSPYRRSSRSRSPSSRSNKKFASRRR